MSADDFGVSTGYVRRIQDRAVFPSARAQRSKIRSPRARPVATVRKGEGKKFGPRSKVFRRRGIFQLGARRSERALDLMLMTRDEAILEYASRGHVRAIAC